LHSLMQVDRPVVTPEQTDRVVLWVDAPLSELKGTYLHHYISWGSRQTFPSKKSKPVPVPQRSSCVGRPLWYDVTGLEPGFGFWPMAQKYRHIIPWNSDSMACNHNLFDLHSSDLKSHEKGALMGVLNSTLVGLVKHFYGRYAGSEGTLKTEVVDVLMLEVPSPLGQPKELCNRMAKTLRTISKRTVTHLVEQDFLDCHTEAGMRLLQSRELALPLELQREDRRELDLLVFELLGVANNKRRESLVDELYRVTARYYRELRIQDIQSTINRSSGSSGKDVTAEDIALDAWMRLDTEWRKSIPEWLAEETPGGELFEIPEGPVRLPEAEHFFESTTVYFGKAPAISRICQSRAEAELIAAIGGVGVHGAVVLPVSERDFAAVLKALQRRLAEGKSEMERVAGEHAGSEKLRGQVLSILLRWFIQGVPGATV
jgi:hypothetical protein